MQTKKSLRKKNALETERDQKDVFVELKKKKKKKRGGKRKKKLYCND